jgi:hypothetical protein
MHFLYKKEPEIVLFFYDRKMVTNAAQVLRTRALQCSFSSVFHLRRAGMKADDASYIENLFVITVGVPLVIMGVTGASCYITKTLDSPVWSARWR